MTVQFRDKDKGLKALNKAFKNLKKHNSISVGILQEMPHPDSKFSMVDLAFVHEYGSRDGHIPERSFIRSTCDKEKRNHIKLMKKFCSKILDSSLTSEEALGQLGSKIVSDMVQTINHGLRPKLSLSTIKRKKSSKALINNSHLKSAITFAING